jgi:predicted MFS family arabinose efflux permease
MASPVTSALMMELCRREEQGVVNALSILVWNVSWATSAQFFGTLKGNFKILFTIAIVLYFTASVFYFILFRKAESEKPADAPR